MIAATLHHDSERLTQKFHSTSLFEALKKMFTKELQNLTVFKVCDKSFVINDQILCYQFLDC
jgi:hypothetical protein